jgi:hypothetical protein
MTQDLPTTAEVTAEVKTATATNNPFHLTPTDLHILSQSDADYTLLTWSALKTIIAAQELEKLTRLPSQLRAYRDWSAKIRDKYGSTTNFLLQKRLYWEPILGPELHFAIRNPVPFADREDYRILRNDWPYGNEPGIVHICVWLKTPLPSRADTGMLTEEGHAMVERFVKRTFEEGLGLVGRDQVIWFKNSTVLQSIRTIDHVHVLMRGVDDDVLKRILETPPF